MGQKKSNGPGVDDTPKYPENPFYLPLVPQHEPISRRRLYREQSNVQEHTNDDWLPSPPKMAKDNQRKWHSTVPKGVARRRTAPSKSQTRPIEQPTKQEQEQAEAGDIVRDILEPRMFHLPTVQLILEMQATKMDPWNGSPSNTP